MRIDKVFEDFLPFQRKIAFLCVGCLCASNIKLQFMVFGTYGSTIVCLHKTSQTYHSPCWTHGSCSYGTAVTKCFRIESYFYEIPLSNHAKLLECFVKKRCIDNGWWCMAVRSWWSDLIVWLIPLTNETLTC